MKRRMLLFYDICPYFTDDGRYSASASMMLTFRINILGRVSIIDASYDVTYRTAVRDVFNIMVMVLFSFYITPRK